MTDVRAWWPFVRLVLLVVGSWLLVYILVRLVLVVLVTEQP